MARPVAKTGADATRANGGPSLRFLRSKRLADTPREPYLEAAARIIPTHDVEEFLRAVDRHIEPYLRRGARRVPNVDGLKDGVAYQLQTGGKRIRAALCATACELFCGSYLRALNYAAAIEHLQNFTLIHDDISDGDSERRGQPSAWKRYGIGHAINIGDVFVPLSSLAILDSVYSAEVKLRLVRLVSEFGLRIAEGQSLDINFRRNDTPTLDEYMDCTRKKTGAFLAMATIGGGVIGGASRGDLDLLHGYATDAGVAFQVKDDVLDLIGTKGRMIGSDILEGKRTLLVIHAVRQASRSERLRLLNVLNKPREAKTPADVQWACELYRRTGAIEYAERIAESLVKRATACLLQLPESEAKYRMLQITKYLSRRTH